MWHNQLFWVIFNFRKLYVFISMALCIFVCCLVLFFLFPRSVTLTPVSVLSVMVYFGNDTVNLEVTVRSASAVFRISRIEIVKLVKLWLFPHQYNWMWQKSKFHSRVSVKHLPEVCWAALRLVSQSHETWTPKVPQLPLAQTADSVPPDKLFFPSHLKESHQHHQRQLRPGPDCGLQHSGCGLEGSHQ